MNNLIVALFAAFTVMSSPIQAYETKKVCHEENDKKSGKMKEVCKTQKVHKKLEGTAVPEKKK
jgi:hypothetical protein